MVDEVPSIAVAIVAVIWIAGATGPSQAPPSTGLRDLAVPLERLPAGCVLPPAPTVNDGGNRIRGGLWAYLPITSNPWTGTERQIVAAIHERIQGPQPGPDAPPLSRGERARFRLAFADGIEEAYAAVYTFEARSIVIYGVRSANNAKTARLPARSRLSGIRIGPIVAYLDGDGSLCSQAAAAHLSELAKRATK
jgi:hypothetical protein